MILNKWDGGIPRALLLHVGGNDLGNYSTKELIKHLKFAVYVVNRLLPTSFIFSTIHQLYTGKALCKGSTKIVPKHLE
jgi:hypothetical protein